MTVGAAAKCEPQAAKFRLLSEGSRPIDALVHYVVECPYPVGSKDWIALADRNGRRLYFPRFTMAPGQNQTNRAREGAYGVEGGPRGVPLPRRGRARDRHLAVMEKGQITLSGPVGMSLREARPA
jgi:hypothetical protein